MFSDLRRVRFIFHAKRELKKHGAMLYMSPDPYINLGNLVHAVGCFDDRTPAQIQVATGKSADAWFPVFVHEYCHFEQFIERRDWWDSHKMSNGNTIFGTIFHHFMNTPISNELLTTLCIKLAGLEQDCELRVIKKIGEWKLSIDAQKYAQSANAYVMFYHLLSMGTGMCHGSPSSIPEILKEMPDHMNLTNADYFDLARRMLPLYNKHCIGG